MSKYFDKDFFRFLLGFVAIIAFSVILIIVSKLYEDRSKSQTANVLDSLQNK